MAKDETSRIELVLIGIFLTGLGFYLIILLPKLAPIVGVPAIIGMWVVYRILVYGQLTNRKKEERVQEPKKELNAGRAEKRVQEPNELTSGRAVFYVGLLIVLHFFCWDAANSCGQLLVEGRTEREAKTYCFIA
jgi:hypothetical protein